MQDDTPTSVYRYYDAADVLIYVGITGRGVSRNHEHSRSKHWWPLVVRQEVEHFPARPVAEQRERELIRAHMPPFNTVHNPNRELSMRSYLALMDNSGPEDPLDAVADLGRRIPLLPRFNGEFVLDPRYRPVYRHVVIDGRVKVTSNWGGVLGELMHYRSDGPLAICGTSVSERHWNLRGYAILKVQTRKEKYGGCRLCFRSLVLERDPV